MPKLIAKRLIPLLDLTSLNEIDNEHVITRLCQSAVTPLGSVAAVCILPQFVGLAKSLLPDTAIKIATVANFPHGTNELATTLTEIQQAIRNGADEIDVVMPYHTFLDKQYQFTSKFISECKAVCKNNICLKVILETGALSEEKLIAEASKIAIEAGADFIKTSTGKHQINATLTAATTMLQTIKAVNANVGFKAAGGIRSREQAWNYYNLAQQIMGKDYLNSKTFRIGASSLLNELLA